MQYRRANPSQCTRPQKPHGTDVICTTSVRGSEAMSRRATFTLHLVSSHDWQVQGFTGHSKGGLRQNNVTQRIGVPGVGLGLGPLEWGVSISLVLRGVLTRLKYGCQIFHVLLVSALQSEELPCQLFNKQLLDDTTCNVVHLTPFQLEHLIYFQAHIVSRQTQQS